MTDKPKPPEGDNVPDAIKQVFWASFIQWAGNDRAMQDAFTDATGIALTFRVEQMSREEIEAQLTARMHKFIEWATREHYGLEHAPKAYRDHVEAKKS